jgi:hypothetical protein
MSRSNGAKIHAGGQSVTPEQKQYPADWEKSCLSKSAEAAEPKSAFLENKQ